MGTAAALLLGLGALVAAPSPALATAATALATAGAFNAADYEQYGHDANGNRTSLRNPAGSSQFCQMRARTNIT